MHEKHFSTLGRFLNHFTLHLKLNLHICFVLHKDSCEIKHWDRDYREFVPEEGSAACRYYKTTYHACSFPLESSFCSHWCSFQMYFPSVQLLFHLLPHPGPVWMVFHHCQRISSASKGCNTPQALLQNRGFPEGFNSTETHESSLSTALAWSFHSVMSIQFNSHHVPLQAGVVGWGGTCGSAAQKSIVFHWGKGQLSVLQGFLRGAAKLEQIPVKTCIWAEFGVSIQKQGQTHSYSNPRACVQLPDSSNGEIPPLLTLLLTGNSHSQRDTAKKLLRVLRPHWEVGFLCIRITPQTLGTHPSERRLLLYLPHPCGILKSDEVIYRQIFVFLSFSIFAIQAFSGSIPTSKILSATLAVTFLDKHRHAVMWWQLLRSILSTRKCGNDIK